MEFWFTEDQSKDLRIGCRILETIHSETTPFQKLAVINTAQFGRMLVLDNVIQTTVKDEFVYHEMIAHVALNTHPNPKKVLIIGGGDGGVVREVVKHTGVEKVVHVEIDGRVIEVSKKYLPEISCALDNPRVEVIIDDGIKHVQEYKDTYDVIIIDSTDPVGPAVGLFSAEFYRSVSEALTQDGLFVAQTESPFYNEELITRIQKDVADIFPVTSLYLACVPTYPGGLWSFTIGSKIYDPQKADTTRFSELATRYYSPVVHKASFVLPPFVQNLLK
ncbi:spermidine synthase [Desulfofarcimen acetoxidans DSM 771]|uniref:Polyamine aminopropyltransferase n=1 Tax=Desulfofarcimen acetoxidans (strain ATCC 49208 / DSM 771 / KCTC 5769 / VKM B-1644 / 5575) TaxID=485916 RepID=C8VVZ2_DESAS|nr:polyamine aminopropyltransferase [Desulfofarcimen acetoxidans]ACV64279.1 spermidine synthase [Desulfofarcimen acetoxidans DSM 771]